MFPESKNKNFFQRLHDYFVLQKNEQGYFDLLARLNHIPNGPKKLEDQLLLALETVTSGHTLTTGMIHLARDPENPKTNYFMSINEIYATTEEEQGTRMTLVEEFID